MYLLLPPKRIFGYVDFFINEYFWQSLKYALAQVFCKTVQPATNTPTLIISYRSANRSTYILFREHLGFVRAAYSKCDIAFDVFGIGRGGGQSVTLFFITRDKHLGYLRTEIKGKLVACRGSK